MTDLTRLRTQLWTTNIEYSALVRERSTDTARVARLGVLRSRRQALMAQIADERARQKGAVADPGALPPRLAGIFSALGLRQRERTEGSYARRASA